MKKNRPTSRPARMPEAAESAVSSGVVRLMAQKRGSTRK